MGYYSEVGLALTAKGHEKLTSTLAAETDDAVRHDVTSLLRHADRQYGIPGGEHAWYWSWLKWYPDFREVAWLETLLHTLEQEDWYFIRIGEDHDDCTVAGGYADNSFGMELSRGILLAEPPASPAGVDTAAPHAAA